MYPMGFDLNIHLIQTKTRFVGFITCRSRLYGRHWKMMLGVYRYTTHNIIKALRHTLAKFNLNIVFTL